MIFAGETFKRVLSRALLLAPLLVLGGCATVYRPTGFILNHYAQDEVVPYALAASDMPMTTCGSGLALDQLLGSFGRIMTRPHLNMMGVGMLAAFCSEAKANDAHMRYMQAIFLGNAKLASDQHIVEQRWQKVTAERRYQAYKDFVAVYGPIGVKGDDCPGFEYPIDAAQYLAGLITSVQALLSDIQAGTVVGVPQDIPAKVAVSATCLDNEQWWGVPQAIRGVVWATVPGTVPHGKDPWVTLHQAVQIGKKTGMPLAATLEAIAAYGFGNHAKEEQALRDVHTILQEKKVPKDYKMLAAIGRYEAIVLSDQIWMKATGHRTPYQAFGTFPDDKPKNTVPADIGNLLD